MRPTLLRPMDMGYLTFAATFWVRAAHTNGGSVKNNSAQELTERDIQNKKTEIGLGQRLPSLVDDS